MIPKDLFHYTKKDTALEKILFECRIKLGQLRYTNDPRETKNPSFSFSNATIDSWSIEMYEKVINEARRIYQEEWNVLCMTKNLPTRKYRDEKLQGVMEQSRHGYAHPKMWAHYGENHSGVCIVFDGKKLEANIKSSLKGRCTVFSGSVNYKAYGILHNRPIDEADIDKYGLTEGIRKYFFKNHMELFLTKHPDWKSETEFRWIIHNKSNCPEFVNIEGTIKYILVGSEFPKAYEESIKELCKKIKIPAGKIVWINGMPIPSFGSIYSP